METKKTKRLFTAATRQNDGKTMTSMGLFSAMKKRFDSVGYMKPVGQQYRIVDGKKIDKDAVLFSEVYGLTDPIQQMSPIAIPKGFTESYILNPEPEKMKKKITDSFDVLSKTNDFVMIEGTGHSGVGSVIDCSNGQVAKWLDSKVIMVSTGGIGKSIDEIMLNKASFDRMGVEVVGVILNKILEEKYDRIKNIVEKGINRLGLQMFGAIPYINMLSSPSIEELVDNLKAEILSGDKYLSNRVEKILIGAMMSHDALDYFEPNTILVVPGNREGIITTALFSSLLRDEVTDFNISGIIFTGGIKPHEKIFNLIKHTKIPLLLVDEDSYVVATKLNNMLVKLRSTDTEKITKVQSLIEEYVDVDRLCERL